MGPLLWVVSASRPQLTKVLPSCFLDVETGKGRHAKLATGLNVAAQRCRMSLLIPPHWSKQTQGLASSLHGQEPRR